MKGFQATLWSLLLLSCSLFAQEPPHNFDAGKRVVGNVYADNQITFYCGCEAQLRPGRGTSGTINYDNCSYDPVQPDGVRANRIEAEHIVPISMIYNSMPCWREGGRSNCQRVDPFFNEVEANPINLTLAIGELNGIRSNFAPTNALANPNHVFERCGVSISSSERKFIPPERSRGFLARVYFYMSAQYGYVLPNDKQLVLLQWHTDHPVTEWELERNQRIFELTGLSNPFVTSEVVWRYGYRPPVTIAQIAARRRPEPVNSSNQSHSTKTSQDGPIFGNPSSMIFHAPGCGSYDSLNRSRAVSFDTEQEAINAGYRKARNCP